MPSAFLRSGLAALTFALLAAPALAQTPPAANGPWHGADGQHKREFIQQHREARARDLHAILNIRPDQEAAFSAFEASTTPPPRNEKAPHDHAAFEALTTPQKLDLWQDRLAKHTARVQQRIAAVKAFYAVLSPQQQQAFDALHRLHGEGGHHGWRGGGHWGGQDGGPPHPPGL